MKNLHSKIVRIDLLLLKICNWQEDVGLEWRWTTRSLC